MDYRGGLGRILNGSDHVRRNNGLLLEVTELHVHINCTRLCPYHWPNVIDECMYIYVHVVMQDIITLVACENDKGLGYCI